MLLGILAFAGLYGAAVVEDTTDVPAVVFESSRAIDGDRSAAPVRYTWSGQERTGFAEGLHNVGDKVTASVNNRTGDTYMGVTSKLEGALYAELLGVIVGLFSALGVFFLLDGPLRRYLQRRDDRRARIYRDAVKSHSQ